MGACLILFETRDLNQSDNST